MIKNLRKRLTIVFTAFTGAVFATVLIFAFFVSLWQTLTDGQRHFSLAASEFANYITLYQEFYKDDVGMLTQIEQENGVIVKITVAENVVAFEPGYTVSSSRNYLFTETVDQARKIENSPDTNQFDILLRTDNPLTMGGNILEEQSGAFQSEGILETLPPLEATVVNEPADMLEGTNTKKPVGAMYTTIAFAYATSPATFVNVSGQNGDSYRGAVWDFTPPQQEETYQIVMLQDKKIENRSIALLCLGYGTALLGGLAILAFINWRLTKTILRPTAEGLKRQADFVAAASHELRSPLAVMRSSLSAANIATTHAQAKKYRRNAENEAERMSRLVDDLLLLAGGDANTWKLHPQQVDMDTLLIETHEQFAPLAKEKPIHFTLKLPDETLGENEVDHDRLRQILQILLDNALEYAPAETDLILSAKRKKNLLEVSLTDHGSGIPDHDKNRVFDRFFQGDKSRTDKAHFGLGLAVAKELAELHGGSLSIKDTAGGGATFVLKIPSKVVLPAKGLP